MLTLSDFDTFTNPFICHSFHPFLSVHLLIVCLFTEKFGGSEVEEQC